MPLNRRILVKSRRYLSYPILAIMLLAGIYMEKAALFDLESGGSLAPSHYSRIQYSAHRDVAAAAVFPKEAVYRRAFVRPGGHPGIVWQNWRLPALPVLSLSAKGAAYEWVCAPLSNIIRYIHNQDGEKDRFLQM